jgi:hypothetical protein
MERTKRDGEDKERWRGEREMKRTKRDEEHKEAMETDGDRWKKKDEGCGVGGAKEMSVPFSPLLSL